MWVEFLRPWGLLALPLGGAALFALTRLLPKVHAPAIRAEIEKNFSASIAGFNIDAFEAGYQRMSALLEERNENQPAMHLARKSA